MNILGEAGGNASPGSARPRPRNMMGKEGNESETGRRTRLTTGRKNGSGGMGRWWIAPLALVLVAAIIGTGVVVIAEPARQVEEEWSAITLSFGSNPISQQLEVTFSRVAYVDQPLQWNETGFQGATVSPSGAWENNSSSYGILQFNSTASGTADASWNIASSLGPNVSYAFTDQRVALNGTGVTWDLILSESQESGWIGTSGNVSNPYATAAQNAIWVQATYTSGNYTFTAYDWEEKPGGYQTVTSYPLASNVLIPALEFFEVYVYAQPLQTVVSIVNTTNGAAFGSTPAMHPVFDSNLTKLAYVTDQLGESSSTDAADIIDYTWFIDHDTYSTSPSPTSSFVPAVTGVVSTASDAPFDPASATVNYSKGPDNSGSFGSTPVSLSDFPGVVNSSSPASETSSLINTTNIVTRSTTLTKVSPPAFLTTMRAQPEPVTSPVASTLYTTTWDPANIQDQIHSFLTNTIGGKTGIPTGNVQIISTLVSDVSTETTFSSQAASTIHDYLASAIPGFLQSNNLSLVNSTTGAVVAGADIGEFMDLTTHQVLAGQTNEFGGVYDPVTREWYGDAEGAGFPVGSSVSASGGIFVPGQAAFLGWSPDGEPEFGVGGCFIVCLPSNPISSALSGAAQAVSSFASSAASSVSNAVSTVAKTTTSDVIAPVSGSLGSDMAGLSSDISKAANDVLPVLGTTASDVSKDVSGTLSHAVTGVATSLGSVASGAAGAILAGVDSVSNTVSHLGAAAGSAIASAAGAVQSGLNVVGNTVGKAVSTAAAVISPVFASVANLPADVLNGATAVGQSLLSLGGNIANAGMSALDSVGSAIEKGLSGAWQWVQNAFGAVGSDIMGALGAVGSALSALNPFSWVGGLSSNVGTILEYVVIGVVGFVIVFAVVFLLYRRSKSKGARERGGRRSKTRSRSTSA